MLVNKNSCPLLVHSALINKHNFCDSNNAFVNAEINIKINKCCRSIVQS